MQYASRTRASRKLNSGSGGATRGNADLADSETYGMAPRSGREPIQWAPRKLGNMELWDKACN